MKRTFTQSFYNLLLLWEYQEFDPELQKNVLLPASPWMIDAAIIEMGICLETIITGAQHFDGEDISRNQPLLAKLDLMKRQLFEFQIEWKRSFLQSHVHIFFAFFRIFGNGDVTVVPNKSKPPKHFSKRFGWETMGLWYMVSFINSFHIPFLI